MWWTLKPPTLGSSSSESESVRLSNSARFSTSCVAAAARSPAAGNPDTFLRRPRRRRWLRRDGGPGVDAEQNTGVFRFLSNTLLKFDSTLPSLSQHWILLVECFWFSETKLDSQFSLWTDSFCMFSSEYVSASILCFDKLNWELDEELASKAACLSLLMRVEERKRRRMQSSRGQLPRSGIRPIHNTKACPRPTM